MSCAIAPRSTADSRFSRHRVVPSRESLVQVTVEHMEQGLSRDSYETSRAGYFDYDYAHDGTFLLDTQQRKWLLQEFGGIKRRLMI